ncbi:hypothetical protein [Streptomyces sp. NPDC058548]|uniref:hypothetical protein n=1 Tax=Streptomyces sp. NPDC058548 TaxID=3346545 RepID=UPI00365A8EC3
MPSNIYTQDNQHPDRYRPEGYAWGFLRPGGRWLSVLGSHWECIPLPESPEDAVRPGVVMVIDGKPDTYTLAKVRREGRSIFAVLEAVETYTPQLKK